MKRLQTTKYKLLVNINGIYQIVVDSPISAITSKEQIPSGIYFGYCETGPKSGVMFVSSKGGLSWIDTTLNTVDVTSVSSEIIG